MGIFDKTSGLQQAVLLHLKGEDFDRMLTLSDKLEAIIIKHNLGMFDGNEIGGGHTTLFMYGPDAEVLFTHIEPTLRADDYCQSAIALLRQGPPGSIQRTVNL